ncbi:hypothetical protein WMY93_014762 [Mugilogobius chulae]|uniref:G-protein coupled receptors family 1 profile domain-containing protein n=1 Tax=Mugilogobius chulae TaxID=88201 RepID=A0AAW0P5D6_9GOBI
MQNPCYSMENRQDLARVSGFKMDTHTNDSSKWCDFGSTDTLLNVWLFFYLLLIPLFLFVVYVAFKQKKKHLPMSHSDILTFNNIGMELLSIIGSATYVVGTKFGQRIEMGGHLYSTGAVGQTCFHTLTCVDRYLAVVHPITYLRLKERGGRLSSPCSDSSRAWRLERPQPIKTESILYHHEREREREREKERY